MLSQPRPDEQPFVRPILPVRELDPLRPQLRQKKLHMTCLAYSREYKNTNGISLVGDLVLHLLAMPLRKLILKGYVYFQDLPRSIVMEQHLIARQLKL